MFHRWIQDRVCPEMLIDVADYRHVPDGPGVMLIGHEAHYSLDSTEGPAGRCSTAASRPAAEAQENLRQAYTAAAACRRLEQEPEFAGKLKFNTGRLRISINDRLLAPESGRHVSRAEAGVRAVSRRRCGALILTALSKGARLGSCFKCGA